MKKQSLQSIAKAMMQDGKGILAADASASTMNKRLAAVGVEQDEESRRQYRQLLFTTPGFSKGISGVILYDGTIRQKADDGTPFAKLLEGYGVVPGIKVDKGKVDMPNFPGEQVTEGLDGLKERMEEYYALGARFAKWRAVIPIGDGLPNEEAIDANAHALARYAGICQEVGIVPMIEPEVLLEGDHTIERCDAVLRATLGTVFFELERYRIDLTGAILKTSMVLSGRERAMDTPEAVAEHTVSVLHDMVPRELAGVVFLSGGQYPEQATANLNAIMQRGPHPWPMTFSYSRALQEPVLSAWEGVDANIPEAQRIFAHRIRMNVAARTGTYTPANEQDVDA